jgi:hypothetical protein
VLGHGLGTSREANANFGSVDQPAHNLYAEVVQEIGFVGLAIVLGVIVAIVRTLLALRRQFAHAPQGTLLSRTARALKAWLAVNVIFSLVSYGLAGYEWYLLAGLAIVTQRLAAAGGLPLVDSRAAVAPEATPAWTADGSPTWTPRP